MRKTKLIPAFLIFFLCIPNEYSIAQTDGESFTIYLIRHSEKDILSENQLDPPLTTCGIKRSEYLRLFFEDINIKKVYSTNYSRTIKTAMPTALSKKVSIQYYNPNNLELFSERLLNLKQNSLVVGHSNTTPFLANKIIGKEALKASITISCDVEKNFKKLLNINVSINNVLFELILNSQIPYEPLSSL